MRLNNANNKKICLVALEIISANSVVEIRVKTREKLSKIKTKWHLAGLLPAANLHCPKKKSKPR